MASRCACCAEDSAASVSAVLSPSVSACECESSPARAASEAPSSAQQIKKMQFDSDGACMHSLLLTGVPNAWLQGKQAIAV